METSDCHRWLSTHTPLLACSESIVTGIFVKQEQMLCVQVHSLPSMTKDSKTLIENSVAFRFGADPTPLQTQNHDLWFTHCRGTHSGPHGRPWKGSHASKVWGKPHSHLSISEFRIAYHGAPPIHVIGMFGCIRKLKS